MAKMKKTTCPITRQQFRAGARPVEITINGQPYTIPVKEFSTGSLGWYLNGKATIEIGGTPVTVQLGLNMTIVGSKDLPRDAAEPASAAAVSGESAPAEESAEEEMA